MSIVFLDIDGTLYHHSIGIPSSAIQAIQQARKNHHYVCLCTGRPRLDIPDNILNIGFNAIICSCGCNVEADQQVIFKESIPPALLDQISSLLKQTKLDFDYEGLCDSYLSEGALKIFEEIFIREKQATHDTMKDLLTIKHMHPFEMMDDNGKQQIADISTFAKKEEDFNFLRQNLPAGLTFTVQPLSDGTYLNGEISLSHINKATGIDQVLEYFHQPLSQSIAIGDSMNDAAMIQHCAIGIAVGNADEQLKKISDDICPDIVDDGIYHAFLKYHLIETSK